MKGKVLSINISQKKGTPKSPVEEGHLKEDWGLVGDVHGGPGDRQVSLLSWESIKKFKIESKKLKDKNLKCPKIKSGREELKPGDFAENITTQKIRLASLPVGTKLQLGDEAIVKITRIGKDCPRRCSIYYQMGDCIMPREGVFARVIKGGLIRVSDEIEVLGMIKVGIITVSDKASEGKRVDRSGPLIKELIQRIGAQVVKEEVVPDESKQIEEKLKELSDHLKVDLILTSGGTGLSPRDNTPEATLSVIDKEVPGLAEVMRLRGFEHTPFALLSRAKSGIRDKTLIINLPGSPEGVEQSLQVILPAIPHAVEVLRGEGGECASKKRAG